uniref:Uncharacterized protein n=1 Tax=Plectus sambesii TaxID=2011161 RepID=A0A914UW19_9BILA
MDRLVAASSCNERRSFGSPKGRYDRIPGRSFAAAPPASGALQQRATNEAAAVIGVDWNKRRLGGLRVRSVVFAERRSQLFLDGATLHRRR